MCIAHGRHKAEKTQNNVTFACAICRLLDLVFTNCALVDSLLIFSLIKFIKRKRVHMSENGANEKVIDIKHRNNHTKWQRKFDFLLARFFFYFRHESARAVIWVYKNMPRLSHSHYWIKKKLNLIMNELSSCACVRLPRLTSLTLCESWVSQLSFHTNIELAQTQSMSRLSVLL